MLLERKVYVITYYIVGEQGYWVNWNEEKIFESRQLAHNYLLTQGYTKGTANNNEEYAKEEDNNIVNAVIEAHEFVQSLHGIVNDMFGGLI